MLVQGAWMAGPTPPVLSCLAMRRRAVGRTRRGFSVALRLAACVLLAVIAVDVVADTTCDSPGLSARSATTAMRGPNPSGANDPCSDVCVPDCFCCSRSTAARPAVPPPDLARLTPVDAPAAERCPDGVRSVLDHPPLARA